MTLLPVDVVARQHLADAFDKLALAHRDLRLALLLLQESLASRTLAADPRAENESLDLHDALHLLVPDLNDGARRVAAVGIFELHAEIVLRIAEIHLSANPGIAQRRDKLLVLRNLVAIHHQHDDRTGFRLGVDLAEQGECRLQTRHADGETCCWYRLAAETRDQTIITSAATDRAEPHRTALLVLGVEQQFNFVDGACVIFEAEHDGAVYLNSIITITSCVK